MTEAMDNAESSQLIVQQWLNLSREELDELYKSAKPGKIPEGDTRGTAILGNGVFPTLFAGAARKFAWQGKVFDLFEPNGDTGVLVNKVSPLGVRSIVAKVYRDKSWIDGQDTIVIDYAKTSVLASRIRDEIREVAPDVYLGKVWWGTRRVMDFALETNLATEASGCPFAA